MNRWSKTIVLTVAAAATTLSLAAQSSRGKKLFQAHCAICHFAGVSIPKVGPGMKGLFKWEKLSQSGQPMTEENVRKVIATGVGDPTMPRMPAYRDLLGRKEMDDLIAYLKTL